MPKKDQTSLLQIRSSGVFIAKTLYGGVVMAAISLLEQKTATKRNQRTLEDDHSQPILPAPEQICARGRENMGRAMQEILAANAGDREGLARLYDRYHRSLHRIACSIVMDAGDAHDVVVDVLLKVCELPPERLPSTNGTAWLRTLARNRAFDFLRKSRRCQLIPDLDDICDGGSSDCTDDLDLQLLLTHLDELPRRIVVDKIVRGRTHQEIGKGLGMSETSVCRTYRQALSQLKAVLLAQTAGN